MFSSALLFTFVEEVCSAVVGLAAVLNSALHSPKGSTVVFLIDIYPYDYYYYSQGRF